jgi:hypothetical protein
MPYEHTVLTTRHHIPEIRYMLKGVVVRRTLLCQSVRFASWTAILSVVIRTSTNTAAGRSCERALCTPGG